MYSFIASCCSADPLGGIDITPEGATVKKTVACFALLIGVSLASATDFASLIPGQALKDNKVDLGQFSVRLPDGDWTVVAKLEARAGSQGGSSAVPTQLSAVLARVQTNKISAVFILRTPASTFVGVSRWNDEPCKDIPRLIVKDTMKQTFSMPECFAVADFDAQNFLTAPTGLLASIGQWVRDGKLELPERLLRVYYTKYNGGDFLHANLYLPADSLSTQVAEAWGRGVAASIQKMVMRESREATIHRVP